MCNAATQAHVTINRTQASNRVYAPMKITRISVWKVDLPLHEGSYKWSGGKSVTVFDSTIVGIETDSGAVGFGEVCPLGPFYLAAYAEGVRAGIAELGPHLIGEDPLELSRLNRRMDAALKGHPYVKSGIDIACWDILGQVAGQPVCVLLGGRYGADFGLYRAISQESPEIMAGRVAGYRAEGYRRFQTQGGRRSGHRHPADPRRGRAAPAGRPPGGRRQHRLADARGDARRAGRARRGRLYRTALPDLRGMSFRPPPDGPPVRPRRSDRRHRHAACAARPTWRWTW